MNSVGLCVQKDGPEHEKQVIKREKGAEAARGVLFALTLVAEVVGWTLWYRGRSSAYHSV